MSEESLEVQISQLRSAILTLTAWSAQTHVFGQHDVDAMARLLGLPNLKENKELLDE